MLLLQISTSPRGATLSPQCPRGSQTVSVGWPEGSLEKNLARSGAAAEGNWCIPAQRTVFLGSSIHWESPVKGENVSTGNRWKISYFLDQNYLSMLEVMVPLNLFTYALPKRETFSYLSMLADDWQLLLNHISLSTTQHFNILSKY